MSHNEIKISTLQVEVQKFIKENEDKWNPDYNDTLNRNELSELLSNYGTVNVKDLQKGFFEKITDTIAPTAIDARYVGEQGRMEVEYSNGKTKNYKNDRIANKSSFGSTGLLATSIVLGTIALAGGPGAWGFLAMALGSGALAGKLIYNESRSVDIQQHLEKNKNQ